MDNATILMEAWRSFAFRHVQHRRDCARVLDAMKCDCIVGEELESLLKLEESKR